LDDLPGHRDLEPGALDGLATQTLVAGSVGQDEQGAVQGVLTSIMSVTRIVGPLIGTNTFAYFVSPSAPILFPGAPFAVGAMLIARELLAWRFICGAAFVTTPELAASQAARRDLGAVAVEVAAG
jgi:hypothetical protein